MPCWQHHIPRRRDLSSQPRPMRLIKIVVPGRVHARHLHHDGGGRASLQIATARTGLQLRGRPLNPTSAGGSGTEAILMSRTPTMLPNIAKSHWEIVSDMAREHGRLIQASFGWPDDRAIVRHDRM